MFGLIDNLVVFGQMAYDRYGHDVADVWSWLISSLLPCLMLLLTVVATDSQVGWHKRPGSRSRFLLSFVVSFAYLVALTLVLLAPAAVTLSPFELFDRSTLFLAVAQGVVVTALSAVIFEGR